MEEQLVVSEIKVAGGTVNVVIWVGAGYDLGCGRLTVHLDPKPLDHEGISGL